ncbi:MAG: hypothetical protein ACK53Y_14470 [bacterium]
MSTSKNISLYKPGQQAKWCCLLDVELGCLEQVHVTHLRTT